MFSREEHQNFVAEEWWNIKGDKNKPEKSPRLEKSKWDRISKKQVVNGIQRWVKPEIKKSEAAATELGQVKVIRDLDKSSFSWVLGWKQDWR